MKLPRPLGLFRSVFRLLFLFIAGAAAVPVCFAAGAVGPALIPMPREFQPGPEVTVHAVTVTVPGALPEDVFAAQDLAETLKQRGLRVSPAVGVTDLLVTLLRADSAAGREALTSQKLIFDAAMQEEGYVLLATTGHVTVIGATAAGVFYGVQTLKQMMECNGETATLWTGVVRDWPAMRYRGVHDDLARGPFPTLEYQKHQIDVFAAHKVNVYSPYFEHTLQYSADPLAAPQGSSLTRAEAQELFAYANRRHVMVIPEQEAFGHLHHLLTYEKYADVAESPHGHVLAPGQPGSIPLIQSWFAQIAQDFPGPFLHVGADETFELGTGRTHGEVTKRGLGPVYAEFLTRIHAALAPLDRKLLFWGDIAESDPSSIAGLPKDMIAIPWIYWHKASYDGDILPFRNAGMQTWVAPGDANWRVTYPLGGVALDNIAGFVEAGQRLGSTGELTTAWNDDGEGLFDQDWFGILFGAAAGWQSGRSDGEVYQRRFAQDFYGDHTGNLEQAQRELMEAEQLIDNSNDAFWMDPWSAEGQAKAMKLRDHLAPARLHCEHALELMGKAEAEQPNLRELPALRAMELGARRMDFIGLKFQLADEMATAYATAYAQRSDSHHETETRELLFSISSMNGRCQDLRDGYSALKNLYKASWLSENRSYWLDNVLVRYDLRIQLWQQRGEQINTLIDQWQNSKMLPSAEQAGLPVVPPAAPH
jgi:hexosaminidase